MSVRSGQLGKRLASFQQLAICVEHHVLCEPMSILVTGGAGYIGSHMVPELVDAGELVVVLDNLSTGFDWAVPKGVPLIVGDTGDQKLVGQIIREHTVDSISILLLRLWSRIRSRIRLAITKTTQLIHEH